MRRVLVLSFLAFLVRPAAAGKLDVSMPESERDTILLVAILPGRCSLSGSAPILPMMISRTHTDDLAAHRAPAVASNSMYHAGAHHDPLDQDARGAVAHAR